MPLRPAATVFALLLAGCSNYDFARARKPDGSFDLPMLIADLEASGEEKLTEMLWLPLIHLDLTTFAKSDAKYPAGYTLQEVTGSGPLFSYGHLQTRIVDERGAAIEQVELLGFLCGVLFYGYTEHVETPSGTRCNERRRVLLAFGNEDVTYRAKTP